MAAPAISKALFSSYFSQKNPVRTQNHTFLVKSSKPTFTSFTITRLSLFLLPRSFQTTQSSISSNNSSSRFSCRCQSLSTIPVSTKEYEFFDASSEVELRLQLGGWNIQSSKDIFVDANDTSLTIRAQHSGSLITLLETNKLFDKVKPAETIWFIDDDQLVVNLKKQDPDLKWPDIAEAWESLIAGSSQFLKGASIYIIGDSTEINQKVSRELAVGIGYTPLSTKELLESTKELLETFAKQSIDSWVLAEGPDSVAEAETAILESLSSHVRAVVATLGGHQGAARRADKWRHLYAGFTVWLSQTEAIDEDSAKEEARRTIEDGRLAYSNADVVVKFQGWDADNAKSVAQACLSALKQLILSDKKLPGKKSLYIRLGCRGDWPNIKPPGWDPSTGDEVASPLISLPAQTVFGLSQSMRQTPFFHTIHLFAPVLIERYKTYHTGYSFIPWYPRRKIKAPIW